MWNPKRLDQIKRFDNIAMACAVIGFEADREIRMGQKLIGQIEPEFVLRSGHGRVGLIERTGFIDEKGDRLRRWFGLRRGGSGKLDINNGLFDVRFVLTERHGQQQKDQKKKNDVDQCGNVEAWRITRFGSWNMQCAALG